MNTKIFGFEQVSDETGYYCSISRWNPCIWIIFLVDLVFGPFVVLFSKQYTFHWYLYELKSILGGKYYYYYYKNENESEETDD